MKKGKVSVKVKFYQVIISRVSYLKHICYQKMMHTKVLKLLQKISKETLSPDNPKIDKAIFDLVPLLFKAAELGIVEFLVVLIRSYPDFFWKVNKDGYTIFHIAVIHRQEKVFSLIHEFGALKDYILMLIDNDRNNMLHLAAIPQPQSRLKVDSGAALQLRKELLWFMEVEKLMQPSYKDMENNDGKTPKSLFTEKHKKLVKAGEEWLKGTSSSCMLVSTLIATVMFAALFNVPGGNSDVLGIPIFRNEIAFAVFAISDSASLICSVASILTFLSILTSRCAEQDFVRSLPHRLLIGLIALLFSISSMMVAFGATLFIVLGHELQWFIVFVFVACFICVIWFTWLHLSLLKDIASDEYNSNKLFQTPMNLFENSKKPVE
ncbi:hypothetical protein Leryth_022203 [Lithospermum erythrorhizon]|nr:hypothetical protein Leryth_022203 [Lithospermum erythrorhizon]